MKINLKKVLLWVIVLVAWLGILTFLNYITGQTYGQVATDQFDTYTESYRILRTQRTIENMITIVGVAGTVYCIVKIIKSFKIKENNLES